MKRKQAIKPILVLLSLVILTSSCKEKTNTISSFSLNKADDLTIKKLTHGNPTMKAKFDALSD